MRAPISLVLLAVLGGCSSTKQEHAPLVDETCSVPPCSAAIEVTGGGSGGGTVIVDGGTVTLGGIVDVFSDTAFEVTAPFTGTGTIGVFDSAGPPNKASATFTGSTYIIDQAPVSNVLWADLQAPSSTDVMPTLIAIAGNSMAASAVAFVETSVMTKIFTELARAPQGMRTDAAQLVVKFVSSSGAPLPGVTITFPPQGSDVAYDAGAVYSDLPQSTATGGRGVALVLNVNADPWPGAVAAVSFTYGTPAVAGLLDVYLARGAVTVVTVTPGQ